MGVIPSWIRILTVLLVVLTTLSPRFFAQSLVGQWSATEFVWEESSKEKSESDFSPEDQLWRGSSAFGTWCIISDDFDHVCCDGTLSNAWTVLSRELPARAPPSFFI